MGTVVGGLGVLFGSKVLISFGIFNFFFTFSLYTLFVAGKDLAVGRRFSYVYMKGCQT